MKPDDVDSFKKPIQDGMELIPSGYIEQKNTAQATPAIMTSYSWFVKHGSFFFSSEGGAAVVIGILVFCTLFFYPSFFAEFFTAKGYHTLLFHWVRLTLVVQSDFLSGLVFNVLLLNLLIC